MSRLHGPVDAHSFHRTARDRAFAGLVGVRLALAPAVVVLAILFMAFEPSPWRRGVLGTVVTLLLLLSLIEFYRYRRFGIGVLRLPLNLTVMAIGQLAVVFSTGGLFSPVMPAPIAVALVASLLLERGDRIALVGFVQIPAIWAMTLVHVSDEPIATLMPALFGDAAGLEHGLAPWLAATAYTLVLLFVSRAGAAARHIFERALDEGIEERDRALALETDQSRALTALSAEIAHELKNPLASIKGLGALVSNDVQGKTAERVGVLRREVDRMQDVLEELLNFSRPLVPLAMEEVDLAGLVADVARLHEGTAAARSVSIRIETGRETRLRCDPRKVRSVLINLVQNALEASQAQGCVDVIVDEVDHMARVRVVDSGSGLGPELAAKVFEPGVTTKVQGSGLGLTVARSLARQHGGELTLGQGRGHGCVAELRLPLRPEALAPEPQPEGDP